MDEVQAFVRQHDRDRYLASLFAPEEKRPHLLALYAFHAEVARIAGLVSEPQLAEIRLQWWLDTLEGIYAGEAQAHPVAKALGEAIKIGGIPKLALANMAKVHQFDFYSDPMPSQNDLEGYLGETSGALVRLGAMVLDQGAARECGEAAGLAGVTYGMAQVLNNLPSAQALKQCFVPADILERRGLRAQDLAAPQNDAAVREALAEIRVLADKRLRELLEQTRTIKETVAPAFLHVALARPYLVKAKSRGATVLAQGAEISQLRKQWVLWKAARGTPF